LLVMTVTGRPPGDQRRGGADVQYDHGVVGHQLGGPLGHRLLHRPVMGGRDVERFPSR